MRDPQRKRRPDARPGEILSAALELFSERGFAATRLEDVAARAGLSKAAIYLYFDDKIALLKAIVEDTANTNAESIAAILQSRDAPAGVLLGRLLEAVAGRIVTTRLPDLVKLVISEARAQPEIGQLYLRHVIGRALPILQAVIVRGIEAGEFRPVDPGLTARCVIAPLLLAALWRSVFEPIGAEPLDTVALARQHADLLVAGLAAPKPRRRSAG